MGKKDDKTKQDYRDDDRIDPNDQSEVQYAADQFGVTRPAIRNAIKHVGNSRAKVKAFLEKIGAKKRRDAEEEE